MRAGKEQYQGLKLATTKNVLANIQKTIEKAITKSQSASFMKKLSKNLAETIKIRTRKERKGVKKDGGNRIKLKKIKPSTKKIRRRYSKNLHPDTTSDISNLTATGKLLDAIRGDGKKGVVAVKLLKGRTGKTLSGGVEKSNNHEINEGQEAMGRAFINISKTEIKEIEKQIAKQYDKVLKNLLK